MIKLRFFVKEKLRMVFFGMLLTATSLFGTSLSDRLVCEDLFRSVGIAFSKNKVIAQAALNACKDFSLCQYTSGSLETADQIKEKFNNIGKDSCQNIPQAKAKDSALYFIYNSMPTNSVYERDVKVKVAHFLGIDYTDSSETFAKKQTKESLEQCEAMINENREMKEKLASYDVLIEALDHFINATILLRQAIEKNGKKPTEATCKNLNDVLQSYNESKKTMNVAAKTLKLDLATLKYDTILEIMSARTASDCQKK